MPAAPDPTGRVVIVIDGTAIRFSRLTAKSPLASDAGAPVRAATNWFGPPVAIGVTTLPLAENWFKPWSASALQSVDQFERDVSNTRKS